MVDNKDVQEGDGNFLTDIIKPLAIYLTPIYGDYKQIKYFLNERKKNLERRKQIAKYKSSLESLVLEEDKYKHLKKDIAEVLNKYNVKLIGENTRYVRNTQYEIEQLQDTVIGAGGSIILFGIAKCALYAIALKALGILNY